VHIILRRILFSLLAVLVVTAAVVAGLLRDRSVLGRVTDALSAELKAEVTIDSLSVRLLPTIRITGEGLTIRRLVDAPNHPPIIVAERFVVEPGLRQVLRGRASNVEMVGLRVTIPRRTSADTTPETTARPAGERVQGAPRTVGRALIDRLVARDAELIYISRNPEGPLRVFPVHEVELLDLSFDAPMAFSARLTNPLPHGVVLSHGHFGPFDADEPGRSRIEGSYNFSEADFGTLKGFSGQVHSQGVFAGILDDVKVDGTTDSEDFQFDAGGAPTPLHTDFLALLDATTGDLTIVHLDGLLANSAFVATGHITRTNGHPGRQVVLDVEFPAGRLEDLLNFMVEAARPVMIGDLTLKAHIVIPTGEGRALDRMDLTGTIGLKDAQFSSRASQARLREMSRRAQGRASGDPPDRALVGLAGTFRIQRARARFRSLTFRTQGARVTLTGTYGVRDTSLNFTGTMRTDGPVSRVVGGVKGFLLRAVDPLFRKGGAGAVLPIRISGTLADMEAGLEMRRIFK